MASEPSAKARAWPLFDHLVTEDGGADTSNPWALLSGGLVYHPDWSTLERLLAVPLVLAANSTSGVPALAWDVWVSHELRRAGFDEDAVWPRASPPRVLPLPIRNLRDGAGRNRPAIEEAISRARADVVGASASILGKAYAKQVDVVLSDWSTGPEILISTKRMDSSFGNNAANRVEESYGDAKNLRQRHPLAAIGFLYALNDVAFSEYEGTARRIRDLLGKLGKEDDAYDAVTLIAIDYGAVETTDGGEPEASSPEVAGLLEPEADAVETPGALDRVLARAESVRIVRERSPEHLSASNFFRVICLRVIEHTPLAYHAVARARLRDVVGPVYRDLVLE